MIIVFVIVSHHLALLAERALTTISVIGPAVLNGGLSTFLAFVLLGFSQAYVFMAFFRVRMINPNAAKLKQQFLTAQNEIYKACSVPFQLFTSVVLFGLFHGLLFLPVILSLLGPGERKQELPQKEAMQYHNGYYTVRLSQNGKGSIISETLARD